MTFACRAGAAVLALHVVPCVSPCATSCWCLMCSRRCGAVGAGADADADADACHGADQEHGAAVVLGRCWCPPGARSCGCCTSCWCAAGAAVTLARLRHCLPGASCPAPAMRASAGVWCVVCGAGQVLGTGGGAGSAAVLAVVQWCSVWLWWWSCYHWRRGAPTWCAGTVRPGAGCWACYYCQGSSNGEKKPPGGGGFWL